MSEHYEELMKMTKDEVKDEINRLIIKINGAVGVLVNKSYEDEKDSFNKRIKIEVAKIQHLNYIIKHISENFIDRNAFFIIEGIEDGSI